VARGESSPLHLVNRERAGRRSDGLSAAPHAPRAGECAKDEVREATGVGRQKKNSYDYSIVLLLAMLQSRTNMIPFQTSVILTKETASWLDEQALAIRQQTDAAVSRSQLLRGIVAGLMDANFDLSSCDSEQMVGQTVEGVLKLGMTLLRRRI
jgi:hypothetical protein